MKLSKAKDYLLHLNNLRKAFGSAILFSAINSSLKLEILDDLPAKKILILSPHPDDDVIGCGGTIASFVANGSKVKIVYLTRGAMSPNSKKRLSAGEKVELAKTRENEAREAARILGVSNLDFWRYKDGSLSAGRTSIKALANLLKTYKPEIIFCPTFQDSHPDHFETAKLLAKVLFQSTFTSTPSRVRGFSGEIWLYEIWTPVYANRIVKIDKTIEIKRNALNTHKSQMQSRSYFDAVLGLNAYRAGMNLAGKYAEAFFACDEKLFLKIFGLIENPDRK